jgi:hypothetical protein
MFVRGSAGLIQKVALFCADNTPGLADYVRLCRITVWSPEIMERNSQRSSLSNAIRCYGRHHRESDASKLVGGGYRHQLERHGLHQLLRPGLRMLDTEKLAVRIGNGAQIGKRTTEKMLYRRRRRPGQANSLTGIISRPIVWLPSSTASFSGL